ncbi:MAG: 3-keto-5-aminohexanoate cleavage enzyme [candidate division WS2 bacterium]|uniref:3-keto-5-aminohexanoate cleavage enzyme n=1 Tax=Psychracetigena formicireducens TaxID=2986056 RepID=A0A9E2BFU7_PSYF1|nr:3-keto-5-aminohexanoate cleavage enzyme [Candidatus Psychracetigena formicireducens]MBT9144199.1 3-keto-5-aminohexanoate cleavage enzyme [Candidatus Psychracetigena formicireducens]
MDKLIITVAPVGAEISKEDHPYLPITPEEIALEVHKSREVGASICHLHVRDENGQPTQKAERFNEVIQKIKEKVPDIIIQVSTGGAVGMTEEERMEPLTLNPEMATLTTGTVNFGEGVFYNSPSFIKKLATYMSEKGITPEIEVFETGFIQNALQLVDQNILSLPLHFDFVLGVPGGMPANFKNLVFLSEQLPLGCTWTVAGIGRWEYPLAILSIMMGGNVRVGFEDNLFLKKGLKATSNAELVERVANFSKSLGREIATPDEARQILHIKGKNK